MYSLQNNDRTNQFLNNYQNTIEPYSTVGCKKKFPFRPRRTGVARLDRCRFHTVPRAFNFLHRLTSSVARLFNVHEETVRSIAMYVRR